MANRPTPDKHPNGIEKRRSLGSAFFYACLFYLLTAQVEASGCAQLDFDERVQVTYVVDGDTLHLKDGRKLRLIGLNSPEIDHHGKPSQPYADRARHHLQRLIATSDSIGLIHDTEAKDRYGRLLAHAFLNDGTNLQAEQIGQGLATTLIMPPNLKFVDCYVQQEQHARQQRRGIWQLKDFQAITLGKNTRLKTGYHRIRAQPVEVSMNEKGVQIEFSAELILYINRPDLRYFSGLDLKTLTRSIVEVQGWFYRHRGRTRMKLRHPGQLNIHRI